MSVGRGSSPSPIPEDESPPSTPPRAPAQTTFEATSKLGTTSVAQVLDALLVRDSEWMWLEDEWHRAGVHAELLQRLNGHRALLADEMGKLMAGMVAEPGPPPSASGTLGEL
jgi:hypothetical protein